MPGRIFFRGLFFFLLINLCFTAAKATPLATKADVSGKITDSLSKEGIFGVSVIWIKEGKIVKAVSTRENGSFLLKDVDTGNQVIILSAIGYKRREIPYIVSEKNASAHWVLSPSTIDLSPVEIIGRSGLNIMPIPGTATRIDEKTLRLINPVGTQEILQMVPGVQVAADDGMGNSRISVGIRGLNPRRSSRVLIMEDGVPILPSVYLYPNSYYNPPVERIDRIEIIKGSSSIKYGPQTMGGVINYITHVPSNNFGGRAEITGGNNNLFSTFLQVGGFGNGKVSPQVQLLYKTADGYRANNHFDQYNATVKLNILAKENMRLYIKMNANHEYSQATYTGLTEYSFRTNPNFNPKEFDEFNVKRYSLDLILTQNINSRLTSNTLVFTNYLDRNWWRENDIYVDAQSYLTTGALDPVPYYHNNYQSDLIRVGNGKDNFGNLRTFIVGGVERSYSYEHSFLGLPATLDAGGRLYWERFIDRRVVGNAPDSRDGLYYRTDSLGDVEIVGTNQAFETTAFAAYASQRINFTEKLAIHVGLRSEIFEQENIDRLGGNIYRDKVSYVFLPGLGFNYELKSLNLFGGIHRGYTPPSSATLQILSYGNHAGGIDLLPETSWNSELGLRRTARDISFEAAAFYMHIKDFVAPGKGAILKNLGSARSAGFELNTLVSPSNFTNKILWLPDFHISYTYMHTEILEGAISASQTTGDVDIAGNKMPYVPDHTLIFGLSKSFDFGLTVRADYQYVGRVYSDYENLEFTRNGGFIGPVPAYYLFNASIKYDINKHFSITANGKNLADKIYIGSRLHSAPNQPDANISSGIIPGARRQLNLGVRYHF